MCWICDERLRVEEDAITLYVSCKRVLQRVASSTSGTTVYAMGRPSGRTIHVNN